MKRPSFLPVFYNKLVYIPEANFNYYFHRSLKTETGISTNTVYVPYNVPKFDGRVMHYRKLGEFLRLTTNRVNASIFSNEISFVNKSLDRHIKFLSIDENINDKSVQESLNSFYFCRDKVKLSRSKRCTSLRICFSMIPDNVWKIFNTVKNSWTTV